MHQIPPGTQNTLLGSVFLLYGDTHGPHLGGQHLECQSAEAAAEKWVACRAKWETLPKREDRGAGRWKGRRDLLTERARRCGDAKTEDGQGLSEEERAVRRTDSRARGWAGGEREETRTPAGREPSRDAEGRRREVARGEGRARNGGVQTRAGREGKSRRPFHFRVPHVGLTPGQLARP